MKNRNIVSVLLYLLGVILFLISNSSIVSGSPIHLDGYQRFILCGVAVVSIGIAPFIFKNQSIVGKIIKYLIALALIIGVVVFGGFDSNVISSVMHP